MLLPGLMKRKGLVFTMGALAAWLPTTASATPLSELAEALSPGEWGELATEDLLPAVAEPNGGATGSIFVFAESAVWDPGTGQVIFVGSDHIYDSNDSGPRMIRYGDQSNAWTAHQIPWWTNGTMHGYDHSAMYDGRLYQMTLIVDQPIYRYDPSTDGWDEVAALPYTGYNRFGGLEPFPETGGLVYVEGYTVYGYDAVADSWDVVANDVPMGDYHNFAEYSPPHGVVLLGGGNGSGALHTLDADLTLTQRDAAPFPLRVNDAIVTHDPNSGDFLIFGGDSEFLVYDVAADQMLVQDVEVPFFDTPSYPVENTVAAAIESYGVVLFVEHDGIALDGSASVWVYRHAPGMGMPPGMPPDPGDDSGGSDDADPDGDSGDPDGDGDGTTTADEGDDGLPPPGDDTSPGDDGNATSGGPGEPGDGTSGADPGADADGASGCRVHAQGLGGADVAWAVFVLALWRRRRRAVRLAAAVSLGACGTPADEPEDGNADATQTGGANTSGSDDGSPGTSGGDDGDDGPDDGDDAPADDTSDGSPGDDDGEPPVPSGGCFAADEVPPSTGPSGFAMPTLEDERAAYETFGLTWDATAEPNAPAEPDYYVADVDIHGDTEGDDLWTNVMMYERTGEPGYLDRAHAWARYFKEDYGACTGSADWNFCYDLDAFGADHLWGWGLIAYADAFDDPDALAAAVLLGETVEMLWSANTTFGCLPSNGCTNYGVRQVGRHLLFTTRLAEVTGDARWETLRDQIIDTLLASAEWDDTYGCYFYGEWTTDGALGEGAYASGARLTSPFQLGVLGEALDHAYRVTGRDELRDRMVAMAEFVDEYGLDNEYQYTGSSFGIVDGAPYHNYAASDPVDFWDPVYTTSLVNILVRGYRYTCEPRFHERAQEFFARGNRGIYGEPTATASAEGTVHHFVDSIFSSASGEFFFDYNKGELQYTYLLFAPLAPGSR
ncbi:MAG: hypothetical protein AAF721_03590 [Myxococcota bacterium]